MCSSECQVLYLLDKCWLHQGKTVLFRNFKPSGIALIGDFEEDSGQQHGSSIRSADRGLCLPRQRGRLNLCLTVICSGRGWGWTVTGILTSSSSLSVTSMKCNISGNIQPSTSNKSQLLACCFGEKKEFKKNHSMTHQSAIHPSWVHSPIFRNKDLAGN